MRVDAHHHLWQYNKAQFDWIDDASSALRHDFLLPEFLAAMRTVNVDAAITVQARTSVEETSWLLGLAAEEKKILGVVGWVPLTSDSLEGFLDDWHDVPKLVGFREITQAEAPGYLQREDMNQGLRLLTSRGYRYDLLLRADQLEEALTFVDRHPRQQFILDHAAKPRITQRLHEPWRSSIRALAEREHVACKPSGIVTEADWNSWTLEAIRPYLDVCVDAFGTKRLMAGSDWPVCLLASSYTRWWDTLQEYFTAFSQDEQEDIFGNNALRCYGCEPPFSSVSEAS